MVTVEEMMKRFVNLDIENEIQQSLLDTRETYVKQQRDQMIHGKNKNGNLIGRYRSLAYAEKKFAMNELAGYRHVDLKLTGKFQKEIFVEVRDDELVIFSTDSKASALEDKYGDDIFGLSKKYKAPFLEENRRVLFERVVAKLNLPVTKKVFA